MSRKMVTEQTWSKVRARPSDDLMEFVISVSAALLVCLGVTAVAGLVSLALAKRIAAQNDFLPFLGSIAGAIIFFAWVVRSG